MGWMMTAPRLASQSWLPFGMALTEGKVVRCKIQSSDFTSLIHLTR